MAGPQAWLPSKCDRSDRPRDRKFHPGRGYRPTNRLRVHSLPARRWSAADVQQQMSAFDPKRTFDSVNCRIAKGSFDHLVGGSLQRQRHAMVAAKRFGSRSPQNHDYPERKFPGFQTTVERSLCGLFLLGGDCREPRPWKTFGLWVT